MHETLRDGLEKFLQSIQFYEQLTHLISIAADVTLGHEIDLELKVAEREVISFLGD